MATYKPYKKTDSGKEEVQIPASSVSGLAQVATSGNYNDLSNKPTIPDISGKANLSGGNTFTGKQTLNSPSSDGYSINAAGYIKGSWLQSSAISNKGTNTGKVCVFDDAGWIYYRTPTEILTEAGGAKASDIPTNYVTTNTDWQEITSTKKFYKDQIIITNEIDIGASAPAPEYNQYRLIDFLDKNEKRIGIVGVSNDTNKCYGAYLQAGNVTSMGVLSTPDGFGFSYGPIPPNKDNTNKLATTSWTGRRYKSIADFGFTSQTTVKAIVQKIIDNWYEYCTFACTNDNFNNFSDTPEGYGTLIIEVGSNALRPFISFTKQIGDSNGYKHWQANIVQGANNQVSEIQWYEIITTNNFSLSGTTLTITL